MSITQIFLRDCQQWIYYKGKKDVLRNRPRLITADGFELSVQASSNHYSTPRRNHGPWTEVEVGALSGVPEPWSKWIKYAEDRTIDPTKTVYGWVPIKMVDDLIKLHGGLSLGRRIRTFLKQC